MASVAGVGTGPMLTFGAMTAPNALSGTTSGATDPMARLEGLENVIKGGTRGAEQDCRGAEAARAARVFFSGFWGSGVMSKPLYWH